MSAFTRRRAGRPRKNPEARKPPRSSDILREQRASAISGEPLRLADLDRQIQEAWVANDKPAYQWLEQERIDIERSHKKLAADPRASTAFGRLRVAGLIDDTQYQAGEAFEALAARYYGPVPGRPDHRTRSCLASLIADTVPTLSDISDADFNAQRLRTWNTLRETYARVWDWRMLEAVVRFDEPLPSQTVVIGRVERQPIDILRHDLDEMARQYRIDANRGTGRR